MVHNPCMPAISWKKTVAFLGSLSTRKNWPHLRESLTTLCNTVRSYPILVPFHPRIKTEKFQFDDSKSLHKNYSFIISIHLDLLNKVVGTKHLLPNWWWKTVMFIPWDPNLQNNHPTKTNPSPLKKIVGTKRWVSFQPIWIQHPGYWYPPPKKNIDFHLWKSFQHLLHLGKRFDANWCSDMVNLYPPPQNPA